MIVNQMKRETNLKSITQLICFLLFLHSGQFSLAQTSTVASLETIVYDAESVFVCTIDNVDVMPKSGTGLRRAILTVNPIENLKGEIRKGDKCVVSLYGDSDAKDIKAWAANKREFLFTAKRTDLMLDSERVLVVSNQWHFVQAVTDDTKGNPYSYWYDFMRKDAVSIKEAISDVKSFLEIEKVTPADGMGLVKRPGHLQVYFPINKRMERFAQRALRQELSPDEIKAASGVGKRPLQIPAIQEFVTRDEEFEWLAESSVRALSHFKSKQNIDLLKLLIVKTPNEFGRVEYQVDEDKVTVFRRFAIRSIIQSTLSDMGEVVNVPSLEAVFWKGPKHPDEVRLLKTAVTAEAFFDVSPTDPFKSFSRVKRMILREGELRKVPDLSGFKELEMLQLEHTSVSDISELSKMKHLTYLDLAGAPVTDLTPLAGLTKLKYLNLRRTKVVDLSPLKRLTNLKILDVTFAPVADLTPLQDLQNLRMLYAGPDKLDLEPLKHLGDLDHWFGR
ncbi:MAG: leucine-rich repeat domain-containing protein [Mariniblastus sp.]